MPLSAPLPAPAPAPPSGALPVGASLPAGAAVPAGSVPGVVVSVPALATLAAPSTPTIASGTNSDLTRERERMCSPLSPANLAADSHSGCRPERSGPATMPDLAAMNQAGSVRTCQAPRLLDLVPGARRQGERVQVAHAHRPRQLVGGEARQHGRGHPRRRIEGRAGRIDDAPGRSRRHDVVHVHHLRPRFRVVLPRVRRGVERDVVVAPGAVVAPGVVVVRATLRSRPTRRRTRRGTRGGGSGRRRRSAATRSGRARGGCDRAACGTARRAWP